MRREGDEFSPSFPQPLRHSRSPPSFPRRRESSARLQSMRHKRTRLYFSRMKQPAVYLLASHRNGTLYVGVTSDLVRRIWQHRTHAAEGFTDKYGVTQLMWYEQHDTMESAIRREKSIKKWNRAWKINLIEKANPQWQDLWPEILGDDVDGHGFPPTRE